MKKWSYDSKTLAMAYPHHITRYMCCDPRLYQIWPKKWKNWSEKWVGLDEKMVPWLRNFGHSLSSSYYTIYVLRSKIHFFQGHLKPGRLTQWNTTLCMYVEVVPIFVCSEFGPVLYYLFEYITNETGLCIYSYCMFQMQSVYCGFHKSYQLTQSFRSILLGPGHS